DIEPALRGRLGRVRTAMASRGDASRFPLDDLRRATDRGDVRGCRRASFVATGGLMTGGLMMTRSTPRNGMRVTEAGPGRRGTAVCGLVLAAATSACVAPESPTITIQTFPEEPPYGSHPTTSALVAFQDGDGPWQELQGTNGTYSAPVTGQ